MSVVRNGRNDDGKVDDDDYDDYDYGDDHHHHDGDNKRNKRLSELIMYELHLMRAAVSRQATWM